MKKFLIFIFCIFAFTSCIDFPKDGKCQVNYTVVYPDTTITYDSVFTYEYFGENKYPYVNSRRGTNYIAAGTFSFHATTCPIRLNSYKLINE